MTHKVTKEDVEDRWFPQMVYIALEEQTNKNTICCSDNAYVYSDIKNTNKTK